MTELLENEAFVTGLSVGLALYQQKIIAAHKREEPLIVGDTLFYLQDGRERLKEVVEKICT